METQTPSDIYRLFNILYYRFPELKEKYLNLRCLHEKKPPLERFFKLNNHIAIENFVKGMSKGYNIYYGVAPRERESGTTNDIEFITCLWADLDAKQFENSKEKALKQIEEFPLKPTAIINSGHGYHAYYALKEAVNVKEFPARQYLTALMKALQADKCDDLPRLLRVPNTINMKYDEQLACVVHLLDDAQFYNLSDFDKYLTFEQTQDIPTFEPAPILISDTTINEIVKYTIPLWHQNFRQNLCLYLVGWLVKSGYTEQQVEKIIITVCQEAKDEEIKSRLDAVHRTFSAFLARRAISGYRQVESTIARMILTMPEAKDIIQRNFNELIKFLKKETKELRQQEKTQQMICELQKHVDIIKIEKLHTRGNPLYIVYMKNERKLELTAGQLSKFPQFKQAVFTEFNYFIPIEVTKTAWELFLNSILPTLTVEIVPAEAGYDVGIVQEEIETFLESATEYTAQKVLAGSPTYNEQSYIFRGAKLKEFLRYRKAMVSPTKLWQAIKDIFKGSTSSIRVTPADETSQIIKVWRIPRDYKVNE